MAACKLSNRREYYVLCSKAVKHVSRSICCSAVCDRRTLRNSADRLCYDRIFGLCCRRFFQTILRGLPTSETDRTHSRGASQTRRRLVILGHHYQRDEVIRFADVRGDSFKLAQWAANRKDAEYIIFCGVHFMAESADILSADYQKVILPDMSAGCSMADMAGADQVETCWEDLARSDIGENYSDHVHELHS